MRFRIWEVLFLAIPSFLVNSFYLLKWKKGQWIEKVHEIDKETKL